MYFIHTQITKLFDGLENGFTNIVKCKGSGVTVRKYQQRKTLDKFYGSRPSFSGSYQRIQREIIEIPKSKAKIQILNRV